MPCGNKLASFPNTRERPRKPTLTADTGRVMVKQNGDIGTFDTTNGVTVSDEGKQTTNGNTIVKAYDQDRTYLTLRNVSPADAIVYGYRDRADLNNTGMILRAGDSVDIDSLDTIYARGISGSMDIDVRIDFGRG